MGGLAPPITRATHWPFHGSERYGWAGSTDSSRVERFIDAKGGRGGGRGACTFIDAH